MPANIYTISPDRPFLVTLAEGLLAITGRDPLALPRVTVLLPTRRAVRSLREAFLRVLPDGRDPGTPLLLPRMRPIGDLDSDELSLVEGIADDGDLAAPPAIPELRRRGLVRTEYEATTLRGHLGLPMPASRFRSVPMVAE